MFGKVERFFSKKGYVFKTDINDTAISVNYTLGLLLRKICVVGCKSDNYVLKQENIKEKIFYDLIRLLYRTTMRPSYFLYNNNNLIGSTEVLNKDSIQINTKKFAIEIKLIKGKDNHIVRLVEDDEIVAEIKKDRIRYGKKNIYNLFYSNWKYSVDFLLLLVAFCDVTFFPEWPLLKWSFMEYDI